MEVFTKAYGVLDVDAKQKIVFPKGLYGFEQLREFVLIDAKEEPFFYLQSLEDRDVAFVLIDPFLSCSSYEADIDDVELAELGISEPGDALVFAIVSIPSTGNMTVNLQGPLVIGKKTSLGRQCILADPRWKIKHTLEK